MFPYAQRTRKRNDRNNARTIYPKIHLSDLFRKYFMVANGPKIIITFDARNSDAQDKTNESPPPPRRVPGRKNIRRDTGRVNIDAAIHAFNIIPRSKTNRKTFPRIFPNTDDLTTSGDVKANRLGEMPVTASRRRFAPGKYIIVARYDVPTEKRSRNDAGRSIVIVVITRRNYSMQITRNVYTASARAKYREM